jgi:ferric-dicitrate binding protein FerR (iron transport regulator)
MEKEIQEIIVRILSSEAYLEDKQKLIAWLESGRRKYEGFGQAESIWNALNHGKWKEYNSDQAFERFKIARKKITVGERNGLWKTADWIIRIAAIVIISTGLSI